MPRKIVIETYDGNTVYSVAVFDSYGTEHHLGYISAHKIGEILIDNKELQQIALDIWNNEVKPEKDLMANAIKECIEIDKKAGITSRNRDCLD